MKLKKKIEHNITLQREYVKQELRILQKQN